MERRGSQELADGTMGRTFSGGGRPEAVLRRTNSGGLDPFLRATGHTSLDAPLFGLASLKASNTNPSSTLLGAITSPFGSFVGPVGSSLASPLLGPGHAASPMLGPSSPMLGPYPPELGQTPASPLLGLACRAGSKEMLLSSPVLQQACSWSPVLLPLDEPIRLEAVEERSSDVDSTELSHSMGLTGLSSTPNSGGWGVQINVVPPGGALPPRADRSTSRSSNRLEGSKAQAGPGTSNSESFGFIAESKEWHCLSSGEGASTGEQEPASFMHRRQRYMNAVPEHTEIVQSPAKQTESVDANVWRCWAWCFYFVEMFFGAASIVLLGIARRWVYVALLLPFHFLLVSLELYGVRHDPAIEMLRVHLRRRHSAVVRALVVSAMELAILVLCGFLCLFPLIRARRCWRQAGRGVKRRFIDEIEGTALEGAGQSAPSARLDSHIMFLTGVPRMVVLTNILARTGSFKPDDLLATTFAFVLLIITVVISLLSVVLAVVHFDYYASQWVRRQYEAGQHYGFQTLHIVYRSFEVAGRVLILVAITEIFRLHLYSGVTILFVDYLLGIAALLRATDFAPGAIKMMLVLSVSIYVADVCRYIDEPGVTRQARKVSHFCESLRFVEVVMAIALYLQFASERVKVEGGLQGASALHLAVLTLLVHVTCLGLLCRSRIGYKGIDLFVVCRDRKASVSEIEEVLRRGCDVNLPQMDHTRETALHIAAARGKVASTRLLLLHGADPCLADAEGDVPLHRACRAGHTEVIQALLQPPDTAPCAVGGTCQAAALQANAGGLTPLDVLHPDVPGCCRELLLAAQRAERGIGLEAGPGPDRSPAAAAPAAAQLCRSNSMDLPQNLFGSVVTRRPNRMHSTNNMPTGLASFMFSTGIGDQLSEVFDLMQETVHGVKFSSLKIEGGVLGCGSFGEVFKVKDTRTDELYALKLQRRDKTTKIAVREVQALLKSAHAFIVCLVAIFQTDTFYVLLMELCDTNLNARILECGDQAGTPGLPDSVTARYTACIMLALEYLHRLKIVFRDVKPENILVTFKEKGDFAKLTDFGLARSIDAHDVGGHGEGSDSPGSGTSPPTQESRFLEQPKQAASVVCGTPRFMAEEVYETFTPSQASNSEELWLKWQCGRDWYALGLTFLLMLLGDDGGTRVEHCGRSILLPPANQREVCMKMRSISSIRTAKRFPQPNEEALDLVFDLTKSWRDRIGAWELRQSTFLGEAIRDMELEVERHNKEMAEAEAKSVQTGSFSPRRGRNGSGSAAGGPRFSLPEDWIRDEHREQPKPERKLRHARTRSAPANAANVAAAEAA